MKFLPKRYFPILLICAAFILAVISAYAIFKGSREATVPPLKSGQEERSTTLSDIRFTQKNPVGSRNWSVDAKEVGFSNNGEVIYFRQFSMSIESRKGDEIKMKGTEGKYYKKEKIIDMNKNIHIWTDMGYNLSTERLKYDQKKGIFSTKSNVTISSPLIIIMGKGFYCDYQREYMKILSGVSAYIKTGAFLQ